VVVVVLSAGGVVVVSAGAVVGAGVADGAVVPDGSGGLDVAGGGVVSDWFFALSPQAASPSTIKPEKTQGSTRMFFAPSYKLVVRSRGCGWIFHPLPAVARPFSPVTTE
jgi:hypothetical protein